MNRDQLIKGFSELYVGQNPVKITENYMKKKKKESFLLVIGGLLLVSLCVFNDRKNSILEDNKIIRNRTEEGKEEIALQIKQGNGHWENIDLELYAKEYSPEELEQLFIEICEVLPQIILNENESLDLVHEDLNLVQEVEGYPFWIRWDSSMPDVLDEKGHLLSLFEGIDERIEIRAFLEYEEWEKEYCIPVHVITQRRRDFVVSLKEELQKLEQDTREQEEFHLPKSFQKNDLQWRYVPGNTALILGTIFVIMIPFISYEKDREIYKQAMRRKEELQEEFPQFVSKLILLLEAGMSMRGAFFHIVEDEQKKVRVVKKKSYLYMELLYICRQMKNGLSEKEAYELLGRRCNLSCYKKLSGILVQHLQKGGSSMLETLRKESLKASDDQKRQIQKKGEEMETKLLFPMIIMLGIVMVFIMVPALFSFQM